MSPSPPPARPQRWQWVLATSIAVGSMVGGIASNILADMIDPTLGAITWFIAQRVFNGQTFLLLHR